jgi:hypothetical protein
MVEGAVVTMSGFVCLSSIALAVKCCENDKTRVLRAMSTVWSDVADSKTN